MGATYQLVLGGQQADQNLYTLITSIEVDESMDMPAAIQICLPISRSTGGDLTYVDDPRFAPMAQVAIVATAISLVLGMALAHLLNWNFRGHALVQTIILLPQMIAPVIAATSMRWTFNDQFGVVAAFLRVIGYGQISWLAERWPSFLIVLFTDVWIWAPWFALILLAALKSLPREPFEAAQIDAAGRWRTFTHVTLPMLRPVIGVCVLIRSIDAFRTFDQVWVLTGGGPARTTEVFSIYAYIETFVNLDFGRGSAAAIIGALIILVVAWTMYKAVDRLTDVSR